jgi:hypothetical protein
MGPVLDLQSRLSVDRDERAHDVALPTPQDDEYIIKENYYESVRHNQRRLAGLRYSNYYDLSVIDAVVGRQLVVIAISAI